MEKTTYILVLKRFCTIDGLFREWAKILHYGSGGQEPFLRKKVPAPPKTFV
jgi:hypothetical protein